MTNFEVIQKITGIKEFSELIYSFAEKAGSPEKLAEELAEEIPEEGLRTLESVAQGGNYPLSFDGMQ